MKKGLLRDAKLTAKYLAEKTIFKRKIRRERLEREFQELDKSLAEKIKVEQELDTYTDAEKRRLLKEVTSNRYQEIVELYELHDRNVIDRMINIHHEFDIQFSVLEKYTNDKTKETEGKTITQA